MNPIQKLEIEKAVDRRFDQREKKKAQRSAKYTILNFPQTAITTTPTFTLCTAIPQGVTQAERIGDRICLRYLKLRTVITYSFTSTVLAQDIYDRIITLVFRFKESTNGGVAPTSALFFQNYASYEDVDPLSFEHTLCKDSRIFELLYDSREDMSDGIDKTIVTGFYDSTTVTSIPTSNSVVSWTTVIDLQSRKIQYDLGATTGIGHIYVVQASNSASPPHPTSYYTCTTHYEDVL